LLCNLATVVQASVLQSVADAVAEISVVLRNTDVSAAGSTNSFGDDQLQVSLSPRRVSNRSFNRCSSSSSSSGSSSSSSNFHCSSNACEGKTGLL
jgi:hypothetical protein